MMDVVQFLHALRFIDIPAPVVARAKLLLLDLIGVAASGAQTDLSRIVRNFAVRQCGASGGATRLLFDGRRVSPAGAAYAGASTIDSFDAHDGHALTKGHAGVAILPALLAVADSGVAIDGREFLTSLILGYEISTRAGIALHASAADYHTSGAWNAIGCAAIVSRLLELDATTTRHALGTAEYHGPRSQMMRCIDHPTMVKDGSGWGAFAGVSAAYLAADGFTGAPAITVEEERHAALWSDLGQRWRILEQYIKPYPVCRWAQPAMEAAQALLRQHRLASGEIRRIRVETFGHAVRLGTRAPATTEEAQYAIGFPVAALLVRGQLGHEEISDRGLTSPDVLAMLSRMEMIESEEFSRRFPAERIARVTIERSDGTTLSSAPAAARGDPDSPLSTQDVAAKFRALASALRFERIGRIEEAVSGLDSQKAGTADLRNSLLSDTVDSLVTPSPA
jgi:2-methylcitrate dehydratase PrpD